MNEAEADGYVIDDILDLDPDAIHGTLRWLMLARLADDAETPEP